MNKKNKEIIEILKTTYPDAECELHFKSPFQLLISTVLSAQTTDVQVNKVMDEMYKEYPDLESFLSLDESELEQKIKTIGLYRTKAKNVYKLVRMLNEDYNGQVPDNREDLIKLPGVGRKTANVVLSNAFNVPAIAVDTHVFRVANRLGIVKSDNVLDTEMALMKALDKNVWSLAHHLLIFHGRRMCTARAPKCTSCPLTHLCKYYKDNFTGKNNRVSLKTKKVKENIVEK